MGKLFGYAGKVLRVDLSGGVVRDEVLDEDVLRQAVGGTGLGVKYLCAEVPPEAAWNDPVNRMIIATGPLGGTRISGSGTISVVTKGAMTNGATATQANGFLGAHMKLCGYDAIVIQGAAPDWVYLHIDENGAQLRDARWLLGKDTWETQEAIESADPDNKYSVFGIGPAGEHLVHFAGLIGDRGHAAPHNGTGAVLGSKRLKAIAIARGKRQPPLFDKQALSEIAKRAFAAVAASPGNAGTIYRLGTGGIFSMVHAGGQLPTKNYTTSIFPDHEKVDGKYTREHFKHKKAPCWACQVSCCRMTTVTEGPYTGYCGEEPEYEGYAAGASLIGNPDPGGAVVISNVIDRLGFDLNEAGYVMAFAIECYERGLITKADTGGLELKWGNVDAAVGLLRLIANQEGFGKLFVDGVRGAARTIGGEALNIGVFTVKGDSPRGHDHRAKWDEMLDTCVSNTGTIECAPGTANVRGLGIEPMKNRFDWQEVSTFNAKVNGWRQWFDCLGVCSFNITEPADAVAAVNAATGWQLTVEDTLRTGRRYVNQLRVFNIQAGHTVALEAPSPRYSSTPIDGPAAGISIVGHWDEMRRNYYRHMGWDEETGRPTPETLRELGLAHLAPALAQK